MRYSRREKENNRYENRFITTPLLVAFLVLPLRLVEALIP
jgi:hypothetical protein